MSNSKKSAILKKQHSILIFPSFAHLAAPEKRLILSPRWSWTGSRTIMLAPTMLWTIK